jgi:hypothetical protein
MSKDTDHWDKAAYEFSKLNGLLDEVKLFFGTIPYGKYHTITDPDGTVTREVVVDTSRNKFGCPEFMPIEDTWNCNEMDILNSINIMSFSKEKV